MIVESVIVNNQDMSDYDESDTSEVTRSESDSSESDTCDAAANSFACIEKVKSDTPRARFDIYFHPNFIEMIQFSAKKQVSNRYKIMKDDVIEIFRLPNNQQQIFFVLYLRHPIVGGNRKYTEYPFVVLNFLKYEELNINVKMIDPIVSEMFRSEVDFGGNMSGRTIDLFETMVTKIFDTPAVTSVRNYRGSNPALKCTFWDNIDHFLYPLSDGFVNVWKYCQRLKFDEVKYVEFVQCEGRIKTFDFFIYPLAPKIIRFYDIANSRSNFIPLAFLEFNAIDEEHYDALHKFCDDNNIVIHNSGNSQSQSTDSDSDSKTVSSQNLTHLLNKDIFETPDPHMAMCEREGQLTEESDDQDDEQDDESEDLTSINDQNTDENLSSTELSENESQNTESESITRLRSGKRRIMVIEDESSDDQEQQQEDVSSTSTESSGSHDMESEFMVRRTRRNNKQIVVISDDDESIDDQQMKGQEGIPSSGNGLLEHGSQDTENEITSTKEDPDKSDWKEKQITVNASVGAKILSAVSTSGITNIHMDHNVNNASVGPNKANSCQDMFDDDDDLFMKVDYENVMENSSSIKPNRGNEAPKKPSNFTRTVSKRVKYYNSSSDEDESPTGPNIAELKYAQPSSQNSPKKTGIRKRKIF